MPWIPLVEITQIEDIRKNSFSRVQCVFKHSTRCSISSTAYSRLHQHIDSLSQFSDCYYLDLLAFRNLSNLIAEQFSVPHESPQILIISKGECIFEESHLGINPSEILTQIKSLVQ